MFGACQQCRVASKDFATGTAWPALWTHLTYCDIHRHNAMVGISVEPLTVIEGLTPAAQVGVKRLHLKLVITSLILVLNGLIINVMTLTYLYVLFTDGSLQCFFVYGIQPEDA